MSGSEASHDISTLQSVNPDREKVSLTRSIFDSLPDAFQQAARALEKRGLIEIQGVG